MTNGVDDTARSTADKAHDRINRLVSEVTKIASACAVLEGITRMHIKACDEAREEAIHRRIATDRKFHSLDKRWGRLLVYLLFGCISIVIAQMGIIVTLKEWW